MMHFINAKRRSLLLTVRHCANFFYIYLERALLRHEIKLYSLAIQITSQEIHLFGAVVVKEYKINYDSDDDKRDDRPENAHDEVRNGASYAPTYPIILS
jgi:hypothetical protein